MAGLTDEQRQTLWEQYVETYEKSQESYDVTIRSFAAAGLAVTASLGAALEMFGRLGLAAAATFIGSLGCNLGSYATAQRDLRTRLDDLLAKRDDRVWGNRWTWATTIFNWLAGSALVAGGILLALFVASAS